MSTELTSTEDVPEDAYCGHFANFEERRFNRLFSRVAALRASGSADEEYPDVFEYTHHPITVYEQTHTGESTEAARVTEDEILDEFEPNRLKNFTVVIEGPVGTGKSELCAYLTHKLRTERDRPVLRVDKDSDLLTMLTETIPEFYEEKLGEELEVSGNLQDLAESLESNPDVTAGLVVSKGLDLLSKDYDIYVSREKKEELEKFILGRLEELVARRHEGVDDIEDEREGFRFVTKQDYESGHEESLHVFSGSVSGTDKEPYELLNDKFWAALLEEKDSPPLNDLLKRVGQAFDKRPVCVFEDFSIAAVQAEKLRNYMERDNEGDKWDFIVAGTTDYTRELHTATSQDRFRIYQTNKPGSKQVEFLDEDSVVEFLRPYLAYPKARDDSIRYRSTSDSADPLRDPPAGSTCAECGLCTNQFRHLFPFNQVFLERLYNPGLSEENRRPRSIITVVSDILKEVYYGPTNIPSDAHVLRDEVNSPGVLIADEVLEQSEALARFGKWYGKEIKREGEVYYEAPRAFAEAFDLKPIPPRDSKEEGTAIAGVEFDQESVFIPAAAEAEPDGVTPVIGDPPRGENPEGGKGQTGGRTAEDTSVVEQTYKDNLGKLEDWKQTPEGDDYAELRKYMESALKSIIEHLTDDFSLWSGTGLGYYIGKGRPFVYRNSTVAPDQEQIVLDLDEFRQSTLRNLLKFGIKIEENSTGSVEDFLQKNGQATHFSGLAEEWQTKLVSEYITGDGVLYKKAAQNRNYDFDDFIVASYAWLVMLDDPWEEITATKLNERYNDSSAFELDPTLKQALSKLPDDSLEDVEKPMDTAEYVEDILGSRLGVTKNALDVPKVRQCLQRHSPHDVLSNLAKNPYIDRIDRRVRFSTSDESKLQEIALRMYNLQRRLEDDVVDLPRDVDEGEIKSQLEGVSMAEVKDIHTTLTQSYRAQLPSDLKETLDAFVSEYDQDDLDTIVAGAELIQSFGRSDQDRIQQSLAELKLESHPITDQLAALSGDSGGVSSGGFAPMFKEVSQYYES